MVNNIATFRGRRLRRVLKWGGPGLSLVIVAVWAASFRWYWHYGIGRAWLDLRDGHTRILN
jgi:hypothetical protein